MGVKWYGKKVIDKINKSNKQIINKACLMVERDAKILCPVGDTGRLQSSITHEVEGTAGRVGTNVKYAAYVELGTGIYAEGGKGRKTPWVYKTDKGWFYTQGNKPQPYLRPALHKNEKKILQLFKKII